MGGWEVLIALSGAVWYIVSAVSAANEKKKKKANRKLAMEAESLSSKKDFTPPVDQFKSEDLNKKIKSVDLIDPSLPARETKAQNKQAVTAIRNHKKSSAQLNVGPNKPGLMGEARKAILDSMRKELGLPTPSNAATQAAVQSTPLKVPPVRPQMGRPPQSPAPLQENLSHNLRYGNEAQTSAPGSSKGKSGNEALVSLLRDPAGLKQAIILSEIFQPPVSLRSQHLT